MIHRGSKGAASPGKASSFDLTEYEIVERFSSDGLIPKAEGASGAYSFKSPLGSGVPPAANRPRTAPNDGPRAAEILGGFKPRYEILYG
jgi:hypothetical protein